MANLQTESHLFLPQFSAITIAKVEEQLKQLLQDNLAEVESLLQAATNQAENFLLAMAELDDRLEQFFSPLSHLNGVQNTDELREVYNRCLPLLSEYSTALGQNQRLCDAYKQLRESDDFAALSTAQQALINHALRDFRLSGVDLPADKQQQYGKINARLSELCSKFSNHVLDATQSWSKHIEDPAALAGVPESALALYSAQAQQKQLSAYVLTLDIPSYLPIMQFADDQDLREEMYQAYITRASDQSATKEFDNSELMSEIMSLRQDKANLLGFNNYAELSLATKMAESPEQVIEFLQDLAAKSQGMAHAEFDELQKFASSEFGQDDLKPWDLAYYSEKLREKLYDFSQEQVKPYFPAVKVISGLFEVVKRLYGIDIRAVEDFDCYQDDVRLYEIYRGDERIAAFYFDIFARDAKRGGAWMADAVNRRRLSDGGLALPIAFLCCNFTPAAADMPSLLTHNDVTTLFHEFGHGLHHMLTQVDVLGVSGISGVEWDAVELPSQFMENWCWDERVIPLISGHYQSGEPLPKDLLDKMLAAKNFQSGMQMLRQVEFALFDMRIHQQGLSAQADIQACLDQVRKESAVMPALAYNRFQHSFSHIFAGGYAAGYYSYKWAEVLSADAFSVFEEQGIFDQASGRLFVQEVLSQGGSRPAAELFANFRGRKPSIDALLRHSGIAA